MGQSFLSQLLVERDVAMDHFMVTRHGKENGCWTLDGSLSGSGATKKTTLLILRQLPYAVESL